MKASVRVVRMLIDCPLRGLTRCPLIVKLVGDLGSTLVDPAHPRLHLRQAPAVRIKRLDHAPALIAQIFHLGRERTDLVGDHPHGLDRPIEIIPNVRVVIVFDLLIRALRRVTRFRRCRRDVREARVKSSADVAQARDDGRGGSTNDAYRRRDDRGDDLRVGDDVNHRQAP